ncbi:MAG: hypothetical protein JST16_05035 [Bdellovibrionales bacterium]|nr:hypothetical protein [Bdellovibrionales bacterium]
MLISNKQLQANQANAKKSTGPKTQAGKDIAKLNALRTALYTKQTVVYSAGETDAMWESHRQAVVDDLKPQGAIQLLLVEDIASATFRIRRIRRMESGHLDARCEHTYNATIMTTPTGKKFNPIYDGYPTGQDQADSRLLGDTGAQVTTCTKLLPEIWRQEQRLQSAWQRDLKLLKQLQAEQSQQEPEPEVPLENEPESTETKGTPVPQPIMLKPSQPPTQPAQGEAEAKPTSDPTLK